MPRNAERMIGDTLPRADSKKIERLPSEIFSLASSRHERPRLIIQPGAFVALAIGALVAFAMIGYLGYPGDATTGYFGYMNGSVQFYLLSHPAGILFAWFGAVILVIQWTVFRGKSAVASDLAAGEVAANDAAISDAEVRRIRNWKWAVTLITIVCMAIEAAIYLKPDILNGLPSTGSGIGATLSQGRLFWNSVNLLIIGIYVFDRGRQWLFGVRAASGTTLQRPNVSSEKQITSLGISLPRWELIAQDLFAGAVLCFALGFVLQSEVLNFIFQPFQRLHITSCVVSSVFGVCQEGGAHNPPTLHAIDWFAGYLLFGISLLLLVSVLIVRVMYVFRDKDISAAVAEGVGSLVRSLINLVKVFLPNLQNVLWPILILVGTAALGVSARLLEMYLHILSDQHTCSVGSPCPELSEFSFYFSKTVDSQYWLSHSLSFELLVLALALGLGLAGIFFILLSARVLLLRKVAQPLWANWVRFFLVTAFFIVCFLWLFSTLESAFMGMFLLVGVTSRVPFPQPGVSTVGSIVVCAIAFIVFLVHQRLHGRKPWHVLLEILKGA
jgi:hypothetical protein